MQHDTSPQPNDDAGKRSPRSAKGGGTFRKKKGGKRKRKGKRGDGKAAWFMTGWLPALCHRQHQRPWSPPAPVRTT